MKMYFSGSFRRIVAHRMIEYNAPRLFTYAYPKELNMYLDIATSEGVRCDIMVDSGAFTAWNKGTPVELDELLDYHKMVLDIYGAHHDFVFIALDVIPGERGRMAEEPEIQRGMQQSMENFLKMWDFHGGNVLPVYHSGEPASFRDDFLKTTNHICLSMNQNLTEKQRVDWAMRAQVPGVKLHGLAATGTRIMSYVDWYSVDSAGWLMTAAMGSILWDNGSRMMPLSVSEESPDAHVPGKHIENRDDCAMIKEIIRSRGYDPDLLRVDYVQRCFWNIDVWMNRTHKKNTTQPEGLFPL